MLLAPFNFFGKYIQTYYPMAGYCHKLRWDFTCIVSWCTSYFHFLAELLANFCATRRIFALWHMCGCTALACFCGDVPLQPPFKNEPFHHDYFMTFMTAGSIVLHHCNLITTCVRHLAQTSYQIKECRKGIIFSMTTVLEITIALDARLKLILTIYCNLPLAGSTLVHRNCNSTNSWHRNRVAVLLCTIAQTSTVGKN